MPTIRPFPNAILTPCCDPIFKALFTHDSPESIYALQSFLSALLKKPVSEVVLQPNELSIESSTDKQSQFDLTCKCDEEFVNIEMQCQNYYLSFGKRAEYYASHLLNHYVQSGTDWPNVPKVFQISVLNFVYDTETENISLYQMRTEQNRVLDQSLNVIFMELPKIKMLPDDAEKLTSAERWGKFFLYADNPEKQQFISELCHAEEGIMQAEKTLSQISQDELNWQRQKTYWGNISNWKTIRIEAETIGMQKGMEKGIQEGLEKGSLIAKQETARRMIAKNTFPIEEIAEISGLSVEEIKEL
ncbi:MAG: Rpn family recombination-promoting nuclease/putative transposase [Treponema sp.]|nr:Rpn family recombination-promoting nuclease/putative transposase [Treponema sp.]